MKPIKNILFDCDWTLYSFFPWNTFVESSLWANIKNNATAFLIKLWNKKPEKTIVAFEKEYWIHLSKAFFDLYNVSKSEYYKNVWWSIDPKKNIILISDICFIFDELRKRWFKIYLASDAPLVWVNNIVKCLNIESYITKVYACVDENTKANWWQYKNIIKELNPMESLMVWDEELSDITSAQNFLFQTCFYSKYIKSENADYSITKLENLLSLKNL